MAWRESKLIFIIFLLSIAYSINLEGQELKEQSVDSLWWEQKIEQLDYTEDEVKERDPSGEMPDMSWIASPIVKYTILAFIIIGLLALLYYLFRNDFFNISEDENEREYHLLLEEELDNRFYEMDLAKLLKEALANSNWKQAIRLRFLMILSSLIEGERIDWHKDLTNLQIVYQLAEKGERKRFSEIVFEFERTWYGDQIVSNESFIVFDKRAISFIQLLNGNSEE